MRTADQRFFDPGFFDPAFALLTGRFATWVARTGFAVFRRAFVGAVFRAAFVGAVFRAAFVGAVFRAALVGAVFRAAFVGVDRVLGAALLPARFVLVTRADGARPGAVLPTRFEALAGRAVSAAPRPSRFDARLASAVCRAPVAPFFAAVLARDARAER